MSQLNSMTGFSRQSGCFENYSWTIEARSVNGKALDTRFRIGANFDDIEAHLRTEIPKLFKRGNMQISLNVEREQKKLSYTINKPLVDQLLELSKELAAQGLATPSFDSLMAVRGVVEQTEEADSDETEAQLKQQLKASASQLLKDLYETRQSEGAKMADVLLQQLDEITNLVGQAQKIAENQPERLKQKLAGQVKELLDDSAVSEERMAQELAILITKADIREELDRLEAHIVTAKELLAQGSPVGRKLDFLCQEFNREANTLCSKASEVSLTNIGLSLKAVIEQFREQVQNVE